ncbi:predicted protein [Naegleria gruberi]|uniref:Predicted protein n=1 Tax=Naegleria gruberi TaxID=5762 RepID=D2W4W2_NAEGR|nr:uncharacterized protein NAEGRDRAFT_76450 [Naegleria gruberi]EFC35890.1 predicted protein [Naegleria gruberi]|eukprot:XP_002668634.1 predicted protein [Naegleria gruberi strain NEG-M]
MWKVNGELPIGKISIEESRWRSILLVDSNFAVESLNYLEKVTSLWIIRVAFKLNNVFQLVNIDDLILEHVKFMPEIYDNRIYKSPFVSLRFIKYVVLFRTEIDGFSYQTALSIEYSVNVLISYSSFSNNHVNSKDSNTNILLAKGLNQLHVLYCNFFNNIAEYGSVFEITGISSLLISMNSFHNNTIANSALYLGRYVDTHYSYVRIQNSIFTDNKSYSKGGALTIDKLSSEPNLSIEVYGCSFSENSGEFGGAIHSFSKLLVTGGMFYSNTAVQQGGAIFAKDGLSLRSTYFINNSVIDTSLTYCTDNNCIGSGGAVSFLVENGSDSSLVIFRSSFDGNTATRGGGISISRPDELSIEGNTFKDCKADFAGGALFISSILNQTFSSSLIESNEFSNNQGLTYGDDMSSIVYTVNWKYSIDGKQYNYLDSNGIKIYPGQVFSLFPEAFDIFDQYIPVLKETSELGIKNSDKFQLERQGYSFGNIFISVINQTDFDSTKLTLVSAFSVTISEIPIIVEPCPSDTSLKPANYGKSYDFICQQKPSYDYVIAVAVTLTVLTLSFSVGMVAVCTYLCVKITRKVNYWVKRDKAEKDIEKRLLENEITYMEDHSLQTVNSTGSGKRQQVSFIISIDQIFPEKKIGEGGSGVVYLGKWHHHPVAIKCLKIEDTANSDEIEKEAAMLCRLRHPNIVLFYGVSLTQHKQYLVVEYLERGSLEKYIQDMKRQEISVTFSEKLKLLIDIACGMVYLHSLKIIHR